MKKVIIMIIAIIMMASITSCRKEEEPMYTLRIRPYNGYATVTILEEGKDADFETRYENRIEYRVYNDTINGGWIAPWFEVSMDEAQAIVEEYFVCQRNP